MMIRSCRVTGVFPLRDGSGAQFCCLRRSICLLETRLLPDPGPKMPQGEGLLLMRSSKPDVHPHPDSLYSPTRVYNSRPTQYTLKHPSQTCSSIIQRPTRLSPKNSIQKSLKTFKYPIQLYKNMYKYKMIKLQCIPQNAIVPPPQYAKSQH